MDISRLKEEILLQLPVKFRRWLCKIDFTELQEIRFRCGRPVMLYQSGKSLFLTESGETSAQPQETAFVGREELAALLAAFCENSVYAYQHELVCGFLTIRGGHRVGVCGRCVLKDGKITNITEVSGLNLRIAKEYIGCAEKLLPGLMRGERAVANTVLLAPPQCGKTTVLRDLSRLLSRCFKVVIVDERSEIAAVKGGVPQFQVGLQTDVLDRFPKAYGMMCAVRSLSPEVIMTDELGGEEDIAAVKAVFNAGCRIITSMHGYSSDELRGERRELYTLFDRAVLLDRKNGAPRVARVVDIRSNEVIYSAEGSVC